MAHRLTFYPLGNADSLCVETEGGRVLIVDYGYERTEAKDDKRCDLPMLLRRKLRDLKRTDVDVFCITHIDRDHIHRAHEFFFLDHAQVYQTGDRIAIKELWVPAGVLTEEGCTDEDRIWRAEARHRLLQGKGIRVFGRPERLKNWMAASGIEFSSRAHLITDAGSTVPGFTLESDQVEFFLHSPHAFQINEREIEDRNQDCVVMQVVFSSGGVQTKVILAGDITCDPMADIVNITKHHGNHVRLDYDVFKVPHHCSYLSLSSEKGATQTVPRKEIAEWFERGSQRCKLISSSWIIQSVDSAQPPHIQAKNYYETVRSAKAGQFKVTMEHPNGLYPEPLIIEIDSFQATIVGTAASVGTVSATSANPPKAGT